MTRVLITGCSTGIGRATAAELTKRGFEVTATARRPETLDDLDVKERLALDVDSDASVAAAVDSAGVIDVLVNNAGFGVGGPVEKVPLEEARRVFETNVFGVARMVQAVLPQMRERQRGTIVNVSSIAGRAGPPLGGFYAATKFAVEGLTESLSFEVGHFGIRVALIEPGVIETNFQGNEAFFGTDTAPYDELSRQWDSARGVLAGDSPPGPELVAATIAEAIETDTPRLRWPVGPDAEMVSAVREQMEYEDFLATMRSTLNLDW